ncbi:Redoxin-domain-containing protein [Infundibulicybe gibba]|nr:Redoxin-domain-containing protein [Infundibulicybe gibba]
MASAIAGVAQAAHSVATSILATAQIQPGGVIPAQSVKEDAADTPTPLVLKGRNIIVGVPGAFTGTCSGQIPGYINNYNEFKAKGINEIFVVGVNDVFVMKAWKAKLAPEGTPIHFIADDRAAFVSSLGLVFDASPLLGGPRSKRFVIVTEDDKVVTVASEPNPGQLTITEASKILAVV